jgi:hypothetical protein
MDARGRLASVLTAVFLALCVSFAGCDSGDADGSPYFIRFNAGGGQVFFNGVNAVWGAFAQASTQHNAVFSAFNQSSNVSVQVFDRAPVAEGTYSGYSFDQGAVIGILIAYQNPAGVTFVSGPMPSADTRVIITQISPTAVRGTFQGTLRSAGQPDLAVTGGEFHVQRTP